MNRTVTLALMFAAGAAGADPVQTAWILATGQTRIAPEVHSVVVREDEVEVRSAGISLQYLGPLQSAPLPAESVREFVFRIPRRPEASARPLPRVPVDIVGVFVNGGPIYNQFETLSYNAANLWHYDPIHPSPAATHAPQPGLLDRLAEDTGRHSPIIGFALDGYPVYGSWANVNGVLRRMRSSYRLRSMAVRRQWPDGTALTPEQYGPDVSESDPLGTFAEDYEYAAGSGDLDECNGRFAVTPEYPQGTYAYFLTPAAYPYLIGPRFHGKVPAGASTPYFPIGTRGNVSLGASSATLRAGEEVRLRFQMPFRHLEFVHERPIHLIIVSEDLEDFQHIHPGLAPGDFYEVTHRFARAGRYRLWADFSLPGEAPRVESFGVMVAGENGVVPPATAESLRVELAPERPLQAGVDIPIHLKLKGDHAGLEPYLGAWAHVIVVSSDLGTYTHAHPLETDVTVSAVHTHVTAGPPPEEVTIVTSFPRAGVYRMWAQFQQAGKVHTVPFDLVVAEGAAPKSAITIPAGAIEIRVTPHGYDPASLQIPAGRAVTLAITRDGAPNCGSEIVFPALAIRHKLPLGETVLIALPAQTKGEIAFSCGMGMYRGMLVAR